MEAKEALRVARSSKCPSDHWQDRLASHVLQHAEIIDPEETLVFINVGANKGYRVAEFLQRYTATGVNATTWYEAISHDKEVARVVHARKENVCGACADCLKHVRNVGARNVSVHAVDILPANVRLLRHLFNQFRVPGQAWNFAVTNSSLLSVRIEEFPAGFELASAIPHADSAWRTGVPVPSTTIDWFLKAHHIERAHFVAIDAEGWDPLVLEGMSEALSHRKIDVLEFEYHGLGFWNTVRSENFGEPRQLREVLRRLLGFGYQCFWQGGNGVLAAASGHCWQEAYEFHDWSNLVCTHRHEMQRVFR
jgi:FkbM family methyltransferase